MSFTISQKWLAHETLMLKSKQIWWAANLSSVALLFKISENLIESNLLTAPKAHLIKIVTFLKKIDSYPEKYKFARRFEGPDSSKFLSFIHKSVSGILHGEKLQTLVGRAKCITFVEYT